MDEKWYCDAVLICISFIMRKFEHLSIYSCSIYVSCLVNYLFISFAHFLLGCCGGGRLDTKSCLTLCDPMTVSRQASLSMGFPRQEYWSGLPFPSPEDLPSPGSEPESPALAGGFLNC